MHSATKRLHLQLAPETERCETSSLQLVIQGWHVLADNLRPAFCQCARLDLHLIYGRLDPLRRRGVDSLNLAEQILRRVQSTERRGRSRSRIWWSQFLEPGVQPIQFVLDIFWQ